MEKIWDNLDMIGYKSYSLNYIITFILLNFLYFTLARFNNLKHIRVKHLKFKKDFIEICVQKSKTDQSGRGQTIFLPHEKRQSPYNLICEYIHDFDFKNDDFLFCPLRWNKLSKRFELNKDKSLSYSAAYTCVKTYLNYCKIDPTGISLHSCRLGGTIDMFRLGVKDEIIDKRGRWRNKSTKYIYNQMTKKDFSDQILRYIDKL